MTERDEPGRRIQRDNDPSEDQELPTPPVESDGDYYEFGEEPPESTIIYPPEEEDQDPSPRERR